MKILYVKNGSKRARCFQLQTTLYEDDGLSGKKTKFVKKTALCDAAVSHLKQMKASYEKLSQCIIDPRVKLARIIDETENSLTFEYINGITYKEKYIQSLKTNPQANNHLISEFMTLIQNSFKTTAFNSDTSSSHLSTVFGEQHYTELNNKAAFSGISNLDLIMSNVICKGEQFYIVDYEWVIDAEIPQEYLIYRILRELRELMPIPAHDFARYIHSQTEINVYHAMEDFFVSQYVYKDSFLLYSQSYLKPSKRMDELAAVEQQKNQQLAEQSLKLESQLETVKQELELIKHSTIWKASAVIRSSPLINKIRQLFRSNSI